MKIKTCINCGLDYPTINHDNRSKICNLCKFEKKEANKIFYCKTCSIKGKRNSKSQIYCKKCLKDNKKKSQYKCNKKSISKYTEIKYANVI